MQTDSNHSHGLKQSTLASFTPLHLETRVAVETAVAARHLCRQPQTLRGWACLSTGPLQPVRLNGRLAWRVEDIRKLLGIAQVDAGIKAATAANPQPQKQWAVAKGSAGQALPAGSAK